MIEYLQNGKISTNHKDFKNLPYQGHLNKMISHGKYLFHDFFILPPISRNFFADLDEVEYNHGFDLKSAIDPRAMPFTNYTFDFKGMIDYIFYPR